MQFGSQVATTRTLNQKTVSNSVNLRLPTGDHFFNYLPQGEYHDWIFINYTSYGT